MMVDTDSDIEAGFFVSLADTSKPFGHIRGSAK
jgi:hypothetical protein